VGIKGTPAGDRYNWFLVQLFGDCFNKPLQSYQNIKGDTYILIYNDQFLQ